MQLFALLVNDGSASSSKSQLSVINVVLAFSDVVLVGSVLTDLASENAVENSSGLEKASFGRLAFNG